jgi:Domain of unknown function (DUF4145)
MPGGRTESEFASEIPKLLDAQCGYCGRSIGMDRIGPVIEFSRDRVGSNWESFLHATYLCPREACFRPSIAFFRLGHSAGGYHHLKGEPVLIPRGQAQKMEGLSSAIETDRLEAWSCYYGGDYRAAIIMGRAAIQRAVRLLEAEGAGLKAEINDLAQRRKITEALRDAAHEVRISGDDAAHPEDLELVSSDEAKESLEFMDDFLAHAIAMPTRADARKQARKPPPE